MNGVIGPPFLTSAQDGGEWSDLRPGRFTARKELPGTHSVGSWVGRSGRYEEEDISCLAGKPLAHRCTERALPVLYIAL
jgi:hypothetical protein